MCVSLRPNYTHTHTQRYNSSVVHVRIAVLSCQRAFPFVQGPLQIGRLIVCNPGTPSSVSNKHSRGSQLSPVPHYFIQYIQGFNHHRHRRRRRHYLPRIHTLRMFKKELGKKILVDRQQCVGRTRQFERAEVRERRKGRKKVGGLCLGKSSTDRTISPSSLSTVNLRTSNLARPLLLKTNEAEDCLCSQAINCPS